MLFAVKCQSTWQEENSTEIFVLRTKPENNPRFLPRMFNVANMFESFSFFSRVVVPMINGNDAGETCLRHASTSIRVPIARCCEVHVSRVPSDPAPAAIVREFGSGIESLEDSAMPLIANQQLSGE
ncbi:MAG: hypothetical protein ABSD08_18175 [Xanthobacteraceae bacterium]